MSQQETGQKPCPPSRRSSFATSLLSVQQCCGLTHPFRQFQLWVGQAVGTVELTATSREGGREGAPSPRGAESKSPPHLHGGQEAAPSAPTVWAPLPKNLLSCDSVLQPLEGAASPAALRSLPAARRWRPRTPAASRYGVVEAVVRLLFVCSRAAWSPRLHSSPAACPRGMSMQVTREEPGARVQAARPGPG